MSSHLASPLRLINATIVLQHANDVEMQPPSNGDNDDGSDDEHNIGKGLPQAVDQEKELYSEDESVVIHMCDNRSYMLIISL